MTTIRHRRAALAAFLLAAAGAAAAASVSYTYDANDRLTRAAYSNGTVVSYTYDAAGNILTRTASVGAPAAPLNATGLWWNPGESGWGINFSHQADIIFATWFTYDASGAPWWLIAQLDKTGTGVYAGPVSTVAGSPFDVVPFDTGRVVETIVGTATVTFVGSANATFAYNVNATTRSRAIVPQEFPKRPTCAWGAQADLTLATNYTGLWWNPAESGWGINFSHQGDIVFATWFTYDASGAPWWLIAQLEKTGSGVYSGPVSTVVGSPFDAVPFDSGRVVETIVGNATLTFANGNSAGIAYTVNGSSGGKSIVRQVFAAPGTVCQ